MFKKILIANRGEIACRVIKTAHRLGICCVAVYSDADRDALHVRLADEAWRLGPPEVAASYLLIDKLIDAALKSGAEAIHPGYGFLSENPQFVEACSKAGLVFIGPSVSAIRAMGLKDAAKKLMEDAGVPVVPGYHGDRQESDFLAEQALQIGYPVLIKARAGGGGKGMRRVDKAEDFSAALESAKREGESSFGDGRVLIEKYIQSPRHIEIQVFGDLHGNTVHLFERDCSLQRRHQKVIEEAPAPGMSGAMREAMGAAAVRACQAVDYAGAGTVEFIVDASDGLRSDRFWFMEMNTRLQVEHPVTESITGLDLVEWQLRVAAGEPLPLTQQHIRMQGHAFEARIYAEDPAKGFIPATGRLDLLELPERIARIDSGVRAGDEISPFYDPMIAKLTVHAADRRTALNTLASSLRETRIAGCTTNVAFLYRLANHQGFASGDVDTGLIERELDSLVASERPAAELIAAAAMASCGLLTTTGQTDPWDTLRGWRQWSEARQFTHLIWRDEPITCQLCSHASGELDVVFDDRSLRLEVLEIDNNRVRLRIDGHSIALHVLLQACCVTIFHDAVAWRFELPDQLSDNDDSTASEDTLLAPMPGKIIAVMAGPGASVKAGERLLVMEAMKMEHTLTAPRDGTIAEITVKPGDQVSDGTLLISLAEQAT